MGGIGWGVSQGVTRYARTPILARERSRLLIFALDSQITQPFSIFDKRPTTETHENALGIISDNTLPAATGAIQGYQDLYGLLCIIFSATRENMCTFIRLIPVVEGILQHVSYHRSLLPEGSVQTTDERNHGRHKPGRDNRDTSLCLSRYG